MSLSHFATRATLWVQETGRWVLKIHHRALRLARDGVAPPTLFELFSTQGEASTIHASGHVLTCRTGGFCRWEGMREIGSRDRVNGSCGDGFLQRSSGFAQTYCSLGLPGDELNQPTSSSRSCRERERGPTSAPRCELQRKPAQGQIGARCLWKTNQESGQRSRPSFCRGALSVLPCQFHAFVPSHPPAQLCFSTASRLPSMHASTGRA